MHLTYRRTCRACGSSALEKVIDLGEQQIQGVFAKLGEIPPLRKVPLALVRCDPTQDENACGLLQAAVSVPPDILYHRYWYRSGTNRTMTEHLQGIARSLPGFVREPKRVLDIGCNDGTLLAAFPDHIERIGIDPSDAVREVPDGITVIRDRFPSAQIEGTFDAVFSVAMFYDLEDPTAFVDAVRKVLSPDGVWVFEQSYMPAMLDNTSYDTICHEHLEYYSLAVIESILARSGLKVIHVERNASNGGSIRCYASHTSRWGNDEVARIRFEEFDRQLDTARPYRDFQEQVEAHRDSLSKLVRDLHREGKSIHVYGASTKGNTILQYCGLDSSIIDCAADRNPDKHGARTIGTDIPIVSEAESRAMRPDYYLVLPWHFKAEFLEREAATLAAGTKFIFPLPDISVVGESARKLHVA